MAGEDRCTRDGEQGATVEQRSGRPCEEAHGKGTFIHACTMLPRGVSSMKRLLHLYDVAFKGTDFARIYLSKKPCVFMCVYVLRLVLELEKIIVIYRWAKQSVTSKCGQLSHWLLTVRILYILMWYVLCNSSLMSTVLNA